jgi:hypothetical protein
MRQGPRILRHLMKGNTLQRLEAWDTLGILEAPARISELRSEGHDIHTELMPITNRYGERVMIAKWSYPKTAQTERSHLINRLNQTTQHKKESDEAGGKGSVLSEHLQARIRILQESIRTLKAIEGVTL